MGQKTHPVGLRIGIHRKWASSWYGTYKEHNSFIQQSGKQNYLSRGVINSRGGNFVSGRRDFVENFLIRYPFTKLSVTRQLFPVDFYFFKGYAGHRYGFILYAKLLTARK